MLLNLRQEGTGEGEGPSNMNVQHGLKLRWRHVVDWLLQGAPRVIDEDRDRPTFGFDTRRKRFSPVEPCYVEGVALNVLPEVGAGGFELRFIRACDGDARSGSQEAASDGEAKAAIAACDEGVLAVEPEGGADGILARSVHARSSSVIITLVKAPGSLSQVAHGHGGFVERGGARYDEIADARSRFHDVDYVVKVGELRSPGAADIHFLHKEEAGLIGTGFLA